MGTNVQPIKWTLTTLFPTASCVPCAHNCSSRSSPRFLVIAILILAAVFILLPIQPSTSPPLPRQQVEALAMLRRFLAGEPL